MKFKDLQWKNKFITYSKSIYNNSKFKLPINNYQIISNLLVNETIFNVFLNKELLCAFRTLAEAKDYCNQHWHAALTEIFIDIDES